MFILLSFGFLVGLGSTVVHAEQASAWDTPCHYGHCSYSLQTSEGRSTAHGQINLLGSRSALSDLSPVAGWSIIDCHPEKMAQEIRAICTGTDEQCDHLYQNGVIGTIVRLPEECGPMPFARIADEWIHDDQSLPEELDVELSRRDVKPAVKGITLDTDFSAVDPKLHGNVSILFQAASAPDLRRPSFFHPTHSSLLTRDLVDDFLNATSFNFTNSTTSPDFIDVDKTFSLVNQSISCPNWPEPGINVDIIAKGKGSLSYGIVFVGTVTPPEISEFGLTSNLDAIIAGNLAASSSISQTFETDRISIFEVPVPGLAYPGILTVGPSFQVYVQGKATLDTVLNLNVDLAYNVSNANLVYPPRNDTNQTMFDDSFNPSDTNLDLSVAPGLPSHGSLEAHIIPAIVFGIEAFNGIARANVFLDLYTAAILNLSLNQTTAPTTTNSSDAQFAGCVGVQTALSVNVGTDASFFDVFENTTSIPLFESEWDLFEKCFDDAPVSPSKSIFSGRPPSAMHIPERPWLNSESLQCLPSAAQNIAPIVQKLFKSTGIKGTKKTGKSSPKSGDSGN